MNNINATDTNAALHSDLMSVELLANPNKKEDAISIVSSAVSSKKYKPKKIKSAEVEVEDDDASSEYTSSSSASSSASSVKKKRVKRTSSSSTLSSSASSRSYASSKNTMSSLPSNISDVKKMGKHEINNLKRELLYQFDRLEKKGVKMPKKFTMSSDLQEMRAEYERLKRDREADVSIQFQRRALMAVVSGVEFLNNKFDPFDVRLDGWSENVNDNIHDFDDIFEDLYEKYKGKGKMAPELKLMMSLGGSAFMFHLTNTLFKSQLPGINETMGGSKRGGGGGGGVISNMLSGLMGSFFGGNKGGGGGGGPEIDVTKIRQPSMNGPDIDNILDDIEIASILKNDRVEVMSTVSESELSEAESSIKNYGKYSKSGRKGKTMNI